MTDKPFAPYQELFEQLSPSLEASSDGSHDLSHLERVWVTARRISAEEGGDRKLIAAAVMLHDCVALEKSSPLREQASRLSSEKAGKALERLGWPSAEIGIVTGAILTHSYSAGLTPMTLEAAILQDADRLDAIGAIGIARCFYTAGRMGSKLYCAKDARGLERRLEDRSYALDHFPLKLLRLGTGFRTGAGARMAEERHRVIEAFYRDFLLEAGDGRLPLR